MHAGHSIFTYYIANCNFAWCGVIVLFWIADLYQIYSRWSPITAVQQSHHQQWSGHTRTDISTRPKGLIKYNSLKTSWINSTFNLLVHTSNGKNNSTVAVLILCYSIGRRPFLAPHDQRVKSSATSEWKIARLSNAITIAVMLYGSKFLPSLK